MPSLFSPLSYASGVRYSYLSPLLFPINNRDLTYSEFPHIVSNNLYSFFLRPILFPNPSVLLFRLLFLPDYTVVISSFDRFKLSQFIPYRFTGNVRNLFVPFNHS